MRVFEFPLAFIDIETTGGSYVTGRVLEIGVIRVENGREVDRLSVLLNPIGYVPQFITNLTGITSEQIHGQPQFETISKRLAEILDGAIFVAHNVRFDYSFIKREFARVGVAFTPKLLCTVRLSRNLFPQHRGHSLQALIDRHQLPVENRHRATADALAIWQFFQLCLAEFDLDTVEAAMAKQFKRQSLPPGLTDADIEKLPDTPGVYIFEGETPRPLYIGKSVNIRARVLSHFNDDLTKTNEFQISQSIRAIDTIQTTGELGALLLESKLIKQRQPLHNKLLRRIGALVPLIQTTSSNGYFGASLERSGDLDETLGLFKSRRSARDTLMKLCDDHELCKKLLGLEKSKGVCFAYQLHKCRGACVGDEPLALYNARFNEAFIASRIEHWPFTDGILITERHPFVPGATAYLIKDWCLIAQITEHEDGEALVRALDEPFDLDAYKIVSAYLRSPVARSTVKQVAVADVFSYA